LSNSFSKLIFHRVRASAPDGSSPRGYNGVLASDYRLKKFFDFFQMFFTLLLFLYWCFLPTRKQLILFLGLYCRSYRSIGPSSDYILAQRPILLGYKYPLLIILLTLSLLLLAIIAVPSSSSSI
jgi:hypothetical protein